MPMINAKKIKKHLHNFSQIIWAKGKFDLSFIFIIAKIKLEDLFVKDMNPRQRRHEAMHADDFKEGIAEQFCKATSPCCRTIA
jgi:hypothetical protein